MTEQNKGIVVIGVAPQLTNKPVETDDYSILIATVGASSSRGYVVVNRHTEVVEYVARNYVDAIGSLDNLQNMLSQLRAQDATTKLTLVE